MRPWLLMIATALTVVANAEPHPGEPATAPPAEEVAPEPAPPAPAFPELVVVVTGTRTPRRVADDPIGTETIGARELTARNVRSLDRSLEAEPGIQVERSFRGSSFQIRGLDSKYVRLLVDGQPVMGQVNDVIDLRRFGTESIERIEIVRGAASALYGSDALAGVVNLVSRRPRRPFETAAFVQYGQLNTSVAGLTHGQRRGDLAGTISVNWFGNDSYDVAPADDNLATSGDARRAGIVAARGFWTPSQALEVMAFLRSGYFDSRGVDFQAPRALYNRRVGELETSVGAQAHWKPDELTRATLYLQGNRFARSFFRRQRQGPGLDDMQSVEALLRAEAQVDRKLHDVLSVTGGAGGQRSALDSPRLENGGAAFYAGWLFAQAELDLLGHVDVVLGGRVDFDQQFGTHATPRVAVRVKLPFVQGLSLRAAYGEGFRAPSFGERFLAFHNQVANYIVYGNQALSPETSRGGQVGLEWAPRTPPIGETILPSLRVTAHRSALDGLIQPIETADSSRVEQRFQYVNYSRAHLQGIEAGARITAGQWLIADVGYAWLEAEATLDGLTRALPGRAGRQLTSSVIAQHRETGSEFSVRGQLLLRRTALEDTTTLPSTLMVDVKVARRVWKNENGAELQLYVTADNLANVKDPLFLALPGRLLAAGLNGRY